VVLLEQVVLVETMQLALTAQMEQQRAIRQL